MITVSLCMIVKNEEKLLKRCLDSIYDLVDEIIIVDTGSTDSTREIAGRYTDKIYDFEWVDDFSKARNYSFSKCTKDYIYVADADEYLDENNRLQFRLLKENMYPEIEIVQMMYETVSNDTVLNVFREYRPKLYKRLREFTWIDPIHETVRLDPLVFDSDIVVTHAPESNHAKRDFSIFEKALNRDGGLSENVAHMYATELYKCGSASDFEKAMPFFEEINKLEDESIRQYSSVIIARGLRLTGDYEGFEQYVKEAASKDTADNADKKTADETAAEIINISEINFELGEYYLAKEDFIKASEYFHLAVYESSPILDVHSGGDEALKKLINACKKVLSMYEDLKKENGPDNQMDQLIDNYEKVLNKYAIDLNDWTVPVESAV